MIGPQAIAGKTAGISGCPLFLQNLADDSSYLAYIGGNRTDKTSRSCENHPIVVAEGVGVGLESCWCVEIYKQRVSRCEWAT